MWNLNQPNTKTQVYRYREQIGSCWWVKDEKIQTSSYKASPGNVTHSMVTTANNTKLHIRNLLRVHLKSP